jgi:hypothetical protein
MRTVLSYPITLVTANGGHQPARASEVIMSKTPDRMLGVHIIVSLLPREHVAGSQRTHSSMKTPSRSITRTTANHGRAVSTTEVNRFTALFVVPAQRRVHVEIVPNAISK